jgi:hypothetical protein
MIEIYAAAGILLVIATLVVRDRTAFRLSRLRAELMSLRSEEKRTVELLTEVEVFISRISDGIMRADRRELGLEKASEHLGVVLEDLKALLEGEDGESAPSTATDVQESVEEQS